MPPAPPPIDPEPLRREVLARLHARCPARAAAHIERFSGCLLGGAVGDALGGPVEFLSRTEILRQHGPEGLREMRPGDGPAGAITDDTQMTLFTAEGLMRAWVRAQMRGIGLVFASVTDHAYARWMRTQGERAGFDQMHGEPTGWLIGHPELFARRAPGLTCLAALRDKARAGEPARNDSKGCGGVMRVAPVGLVCAALQPGADATAHDVMAFDLGCTLAGLTHGHVDGRLPAGTLAVLVLALADGATWTDALARARHPLAAADDPGQTMTLFDQALQLAREHPRDPGALASLGGGWVADEALAIALYCAAGEMNALGAGSVGAAQPMPHFEQGVVLAVNHDGDSDSTGSIAGQLLGTALGATSIAPRWLACLELRSAIEAMAQDLATLPVWEVDEYSDSLECNYWWDRYPGE